MLPLLCWSPFFSLFLFRRDCHTQQHCFLTRTQSPLNKGSTLSPFPFNGSSLSPHPPHAHFHTPAFFPPFRVDDLVVGSQLNPKSLILASLSPHHHHTHTISPSFCPPRLPAHMYILPHHHQHPTTTTYLPTLFPYFISTSPHTPLPRPPHQHPPQSNPRLILISPRPDHQWTISQTLVPRNDQHTHPLLLKGGLFSPFFLSQQIYKKNINNAQNNATEALVFA